MKYLQTMVRVSDLDTSLDFYCNKLGLRQLQRRDSEQGRFTLVFLAADGDDQAQTELTYNWDPEVCGEGRNFGHIAYQLCALPITFRSNFCSGAHRLHPRNLGSACPIPASGNGINN